MQFHVATWRSNWSVKVNCYGVGLRISISEKLNPQPEPVVCINTPIEVETASPIEVEVSNK